MVGRCVCHHHSDVHQCVVGVPSAGKSKQAPSETWPFLLGPAALHRCTAEAASLQVGWGIRSTQLFGDCGVGCMAFHAGRKRSPSTWRAIRRELVEFMETVADKPCWQAAVDACVENESFEFVDDVGCTVCCQFGHTTDICSSILMRRRGPRPQAKRPCILFNTIQCDLCHTAIRFTRGSSGCHLQSGVCHRRVTPGLNAQATHGPCEHARHRRDASVWPCSPLAATKFHAPAYKHSFIRDRVRVGQAYMVWVFAFAGANATAAPTIPHVCLSVLVSRRVLATSYWKHIRCGCAVVS